jgi:hypothetical protein
MASTQWKSTMTVLISAEVKGQTQLGYDSMLNMLGSVLKSTPGFILHTSHPIEGGWRVIEIWQSKEAADQFFVRNVVPHLSKGIRPKRTVQRLHGYVAP